MSLSNTAYSLSALDLEGLGFHSFALVGDVAVRAAIAAAAHLDLVFILGGPLVPITLVLCKFLILWIPFCMV